MNRRCFISSSSGLAAFAALPAAIKPRNPERPVDRVMREVRERAIDWSMYLDVDCLTIDARFVGPFNVTLDGLGHDVDVKERQWSDGCNRFTDVRISIPSVGAEA